LEKPTYGPALVAAAVATATTAAARQLMSGRPRSRGEWGHIPVAFLEGALRCFACSNCPFQKVASEQAHGTTIPTADQINTWVSWFRSELGCGLESHRQQFLSSASNFCLKKSSPKTASIGVQFEVPSRSAGYMAGLGNNPVQGFRSSFNTALQLVLRPHFLVHFV
jgi:hypothetical protein